MPPAVGSSVSAVGSSVAAVDFAVLEGKSGVEAVLAGASFLRAFPPTTVGMSDKAADWPLGGCEGSTYLKLSIVPATMQ